jgi:hypothetical protein
MSSGEEPQAQSSQTTSVLRPIPGPEPGPDWQPVRRVAPRVHTGELISATGALLLAPIMFALEWFGKVGVPALQRSGMTGAENAWNGMTLVRWLMLATILVTLGSVVLHANQRSHGTRTATGAPVAALGTLLALSVGYRVLFVPPSADSVVDVKLGAFLGLLATLGIALGGFESAREERAGRGDVVQRSRKARAIASGLPER